MKDPINYVDVTVSKSSLKQQRVLKNIKIQQKKKNEAASSQYLSARSLQTKKKHESVFGCTMDANFMSRIMSKFEESNLIRGDHLKTYQNSELAQGDNCSLFAGENFDAAPEKIIRMNKTDRAFMPEGISHQRHNSSVEKRVTHFDTMQTTSDCYKISDIVHMKNLNAQSGRRSERVLSQTNTSHQRASQTGKMKNKSFFVKTTREVSRDREITHLLKNTMLDRGDLNLDAGQKFPGGSQNENLSIESNKPLAPKAKTKGHRITKSVGKICGDFKISPDQKPADNYLGSEREIKKSLRE